ncbi:hypothetical protein BJ322DRAFT_287886 [Thelephora terrestris]|uniref:F-box domain-containing protein n=1 Tax=Thelephora terrestris TaxID=56493 RepID=A0A9P6H992_9AGAM|nr:hypothetical protein BJ322DRAFT_287886 [Thelephora terrestris]
MPRTLPPEILDHIVDNLYDEPIALKACCLVSKSWVERSQRHLFACVELDSIAGSSVESWMNAFPDPSALPARYARSLGVRDPGVAFVNVRAWIRSFRRVEELSVDMLGSVELRGVSLLQFHGLSPTLKSLRFANITTPTPEIIGLICSFPLLEDLSLEIISESDTDGWAAPPTSPKLTGSLRLNGKNRSVVRGLLKLPNGLHFSKIRVLCHVAEVDSRTIMDLVSKCSHTLESIHLKYYTPTSTTLPPLDLSNAVKLKYMRFGWGGADIRWITTTLQTVRPEILQQVTVVLNATPVYIPTEELSWDWHQLDHLLVQLWTAHSVVPRVLYEDTRERFLHLLLPELTRRGFVKGKRQ